MAENNLVICSNCGAEFDIHEAKCPYCGHMNPYGAEEQYMGKMQDIKANLAHIDDEQIDEIKKEAKKSIKIVVVTVIIVVIAVLLLVISYAIDKKIAEKRQQYAGLKLYEDDLVKAGQWNDQNMKQLEEMYEAGDMDGLCAFLADLQKSGDYGAFYSWEHSFLVSQVYDMRFWIGYMNDADKLDSLTIHSIMFDLLYIYNGDYNGTNISEDDKEILLKEFDVQLKKVSDKYAITTAVLEDMKEKCTPNGYVDPELVSKYCDENMDLFK